MLLRIRLLIGCANSAIFFSGNQHHCEYSDICIVLDGNYTEIAKLGVIFLSSKPFIYLLKTPLNRYVFDVNTNQVARIGEDVYTYLQAVTNEIAIIPSPSAETIRKIDIMKAQGLLSAKQPHDYEHVMTPLLKNNLETSIEQINLQVTQQCNFRCAYCSYTSEMFNFQRNHASNTMSFDIAKKAINFYAEHSINQKSAAIGFYGGEPLLEFGLIKEIVIYANEILVGKDLRFTMTTNGSLLNDENLQFISDSKINIAISLDGTPEFHNKSRKFRQTGSGTYEVVEKNIRHIKSNYPEVYKEMTLIVVVDPRNSCNELYYKFSEDDLFNGSIITTTLIDDFFSLEKVHESEEHRIEYTILEFKAYMALLGKYPEEKASKLAVKDIKTSEAKMKIAMLPSCMLPDKISHSGPCIPGQRRLFVDVRGNLFPCERVSETSEIMKMGTLDDGIDYQKAQDILNTGYLKTDKCNSCWALKHCTTCARFCDNNGEWSSEMKLERCAYSLWNAENTIRDYLFYKEMGGIQ